MPYMIKSGNRFCTNFSFHILPDGLNRSGAEENSFEISSVVLSSASSLKDLYFLFIEGL